MKLFRSELGQHYESYTFGYTNYCKREHGDVLSNIYKLGYLPYSGSPDAKDIFYMARSARVDLGGFELNSENRRIAKKFDGTFDKKRIPLEQFPIDDENFISFCVEYFKKRHGQDTMPRERLLFWLTCGLVSTVVEYTKDDIPVAYVLECSDKSAGHYWFSFYDLSLVQQSLGLWLMLDCIRDAKERGLVLYYLGTVYGTKALYKTNFSPLEWWDGSEWSTNLTALKERAHTDESRILTQTDIWKGGLRDWKNQAV